jgi:cobyrinic acid a,c-diamide synthase
VQLEETKHCPWPKITMPDNKDEKTAKLINAHEFHYSRFKMVDKNVQFAFHVKRGTGIDGKSDGYIYKNLLANYTHQRNTWSNPWAQRFVNFARNCKTQKDSNNT